LHKHASMLRHKYTACAVELLNVTPNGLLQCKFTSPNVCFQILDLGLACRKHRTLRSKVRMCMAWGGLPLKMAVFEITKEPLYFLRPTDPTFLFAAPLKYRLKHFFFKQKPKDYQTFCARLLPFKYVLDPSAVLVNSHSIRMRSVSVTWR
jgi:hypothetical protein